MAPALDPEVARAALRQIQAQYDGSDLTCRLETQLTEGDAAAEILRAADAALCDLIVMGTFGRSGLGRLLMGSVAESVIRGARCPVLAIKKPVRSAVPAETSQEHLTAS